MMTRQNDHETDLRSDKTKRMMYDVEETPPWYLCLLLGFQHCLLVIGSSIPVPLLLSESFCMDRDKVAVSELVGTTFFVAGISTLIQTTVGVRLPLVQGCSGSFLTQVIVLMRPRKCPDLEPIAITQKTGNFTLNVSASDVPDAESVAYREIWMSRIREVQGGIMAAALFEIIIGCSGALGFVLRFIGPLTITPTLTLIGLSLFSSGTSMASDHWWIALTTMFLFTLSSQYLRNVTIPIPCLPRRFSLHRLPLFNLFPLTWWYHMIPLVGQHHFKGSTVIPLRVLGHVIMVLFAIFGTWAICAILTVTSVLPESPSKWGYKARTDIGLDVLKDSHWFRVPYPGQWGVPIFTAAGVFSMLVAVIATMIDAIGNFYACETIADAPPLPEKVANRGIFVQGICCLLSAAWGTGNGTTTASDNMSIIGTTKVASLRVIQTCGLLLIIFACFGKFGALFTTVPSPIIGGMLMTTFGIITGVGLSFLQFVDLNSFRNVFILGISIFCGVGLSNWMLENQDAINTGSDFVDQVLTILLSTSMFIGALVGFVLDNTIPGTVAERGIKSWRNCQSNTTVDVTKTKRLKVYNLPLISKYFCNSRVTRLMPFCYSPFWSVKKLIVRGEIIDISVDNDFTVSGETIFSVTESVRL